MCTVLKTRFYLKEVIKIEINKIYNEDCVSYMKKLPDECVDLISADPPYYKTYGEFDFVYKNEEEYLEWTKEWVSESFRILKDSGGFYCWGSDKMIDKVSAFVLNKFEWEKRNLIVWNFKTGRPSKKALRNETEFMWFYSKENHLLNIDDVRIPYTNGIDHTKDKRKNPLGKSLGNVWEDSRIKRNYPEWVNHPTQKPLSICNRIIKASSNKGDLVYIPFAGSGSEIVACINNNRRWIATETNSQYINEIIIPRINS